MYSLYDLIYKFFEEHIFNDSNYMAELDSIGTNVLQGTGNNDAVFMSLREWLCTTATLISIIIILVMCCLFVYKIIKLIGGLIR